MRLAATPARADAARAAVARSVAARSSRFFPEASPSEQINRQIGDGRSSTLISLLFSCLGRRGQGGGQRNVRDVFPGGASGFHGDLLVRLLQFPEGYGLGDGLVNVRLHARELVLVIFKFFPRIGERDGAERGCAGLNDLSHISDNLLAIGPAGVNPGIFGVQSGKATGPGAFTAACTFSFSFASSCASSSIIFF